uniref:ARG and Rhodanese-Phosphatase-superfamily-associated domain-containing protein n=1 Tax=uncultured Armatimonadetes bacterium TaxID=157466 RepID=A0A6J4JYX7_9BACT|nr:hypothetical protein AVDCRST_MAG63-4385 [uncultured Armatimonadetes bacterium]
MTGKGDLIQRLTLQGLEIAPSQVCGAIRLVPLLRDGAQQRGDLRLARRSYAGDDLAVVSLGGPPMDPGVKYLSYIPHGLVLSWSGDGSAVSAARGTQISGAAPDGKRFSWGACNVRVMQKMAKRERQHEREGGAKQLRLLPLHLAMEGFLSLYFSGPEIAWSEYSRRAISRGLDPRWEMVYGGGQIAGFEDALRTFEIHDGQVGVLVFVADALASAFVTPAPEDYRALHRTLLADFYGELIYQYALLYDTALPLHVTLDAERIASLADLRAALSQVRRDWAEFQGFMAHDLLGRSVRADFAYQAGPFTLQRFVTDLDPALENHIGEAIVRDNGDLEYLKTYQLSAAQTRRAYLLQQLAAADWSLDAAAQNLQTTREELVYRMEKAGFGYLLAEPVRVASDKHVRSTGRPSAR